MGKKIEKLSAVVNSMIQKIHEVDQLAKGTLTAFQLNIGKDEWDKLVEELKDIESRPQPEEKKFENVE